MEFYHQIGFICPLNFITFSWIRSIKLTIWAIFFKCAKSHIFWSTKVDSTLVANSESTFIISVKKPFLVGETLKSVIKSVINKIIIELDFIILNNYLPHHIAEFRRYRPCISRKILEVAPYRDFDLIGLFFRNSFVKHTEDFYINIKGSNQARCSTFSESIPHQKLIIFEFLIEIVVRSCPALRPGGPWRQTSIVGISNFPS